MRSRTRLSTRCQLDLIKASEKTLKTTRGYNLKLLSKQKKNRKSLLTIEKSSIFTLKQWQNRIQLRKSFFYSPPKPEIGIFYDFQNKTRLNIFRSFIYLLNVVQLCFSFSFQVTFILKLCGFCSSTGNLALKLLV